MQVTGVFLYPVKSLRGFTVPAAEIDALGFVGDRRFLLVDANNQFLTQRNHLRSPTCVVFRVLLFKSLRDSSELRIRFLDRGSGL